MLALQDMSVVVTGAGSGLGRATAEHLAAAGARVTICGRREAKVKAVAEAIGERCAWVPADVTDAEDRDRLVAAAVDHGGGIDVLINNAGNTYRTSVADYDEGRLMEIFHTNVVGGMMLTKAALPHLVRSRGSVVFVGSIYTQRAYPGASPYAATKAAVETLTAVLAAELGTQGVRVNCVRPGAVFTEINQRDYGSLDDAAAYQRLQGMANAHVLKRIGTATEVAEGIEYLIRAEWTTGAVLSVDGGLSLGVTVD